MSSIESTAPSGTIAGSVFGKLRVVLLMGLVFALIATWSVVLPVVGLLYLANVLN